MRSVKLGYQVRPGRTRPIYHRTKDSIDAHLTTVFAALAISRRIEDTTSWSIKKFVRTVGRYRTIEIRPANTPSPPQTHYHGQCSELGQRHNERSL